jgi:peptidylprolyl isomerase
LAKFWARPAPILERSAEFAKGNCPVKRVRFVPGLLAALVLAVLSAGCTSTQVQTGGPASPAAGGSLSNPAPATAAGVPTPAPRPAGPGVAPVKPPAATAAANAAPPAKKTPPAAAAPADTPAAASVSAAAAPAAAAPAPDDPRQNIVYLDLTYGRVVIKLRPDLAPNHVEQLKALVKRGFYNGTPFHRVIEGFMAQGGDPTGTGTGGSDLPNIKAEFTDTHFLRGTVGAARAADPDSANSQFFICFAPAPSLDGKYTVFAEVVSGMELVDKIKKGDPASNGVVDKPDRIVKMQIASDAK